MALIRRPISPEDITFYEHVMNERMAMLVSGYEKEVWDTLSNATRIRWRKRATEILYSFLNDEDIVARLPNTLRCLQERT